MARTFKTRPARVQWPVHYDEAGWVPIEGKYNYFSLPVRGFFPKQKKNSTTEIPYYSRYNKAPSWFVNLYMNRVHRAKFRKYARAVTTSGPDAWEDLDYATEVGNKPFVYYY